MMIKSQVKKYIFVTCRHFSQPKLWKWHEGVMSSKSFTVNIDILTVNTVICHYNPHNSDKLFDFGIFVAVLVV